MRFDKNKVCEILQTEIDADFRGMEYYFEKDFQKELKEKLKDIKTWEHKLATEGRDEDVFRNLLAEAKEDAKEENIKYSIVRGYISNKCASSKIFSNLCKMLKLYKDICGK